MTRLRPYELLAYGRIGDLASLRPAEPVRRGAAGGRLRRVGAAWPISGVIGFATAEAGDARRHLCATVPTAVREHPVSTSDEVHDVGDVEATSVLFGGGVDGQGGRHDEQAEIAFERASRLTT